MWLSCLCQIQVVGNLVLFSQCVLCKFVSMIRRHVLINYSTACWPYPTRKGTDLSSLKYAYLGQNTSPIRNIMFWPTKAVPNLWIWVWFFVLKPGPNFDHLYAWVNSTHLDKLKFLGRKVRSRHTRHDLTPIVREWDNRINLYRWIKYYRKWEI